MPYIPYWFEAFGPFLTWIVPCVALAALWTSRSTDNEQFQRTAERIYFAGMLLVAWVALRTALSNEGCWLIHMASIGLMVLGGVYPISEPLKPETENEIIVY